MASGRTKRHAAIMLRLRREHLRAVAVLIFLGALVALGTTHALRQNGMALTHTQVVLDCHYNGDGAHTHNADCYDDEGNLVCQLEERPSHQHNDSCYNEAGELTCGLQETIGEHVHGPGCFVAVQVEDASENVAPASDGATTASAGDETTSAEPSDPQAATPDDQAAAPADPTTAYDAPVDEATAAAMPEQAFEHTFTQTDWYGNEFPVLTVRVNAPAGALPQDTTMQAQWVDPTDLSAKAQQAVEDAVAEKTEGKIIGQQAVDITFYDAEGNKVEPAREVTVTFASDMLDTKDKPVVVHVDDLTEDEAQQLEQGLAEGKTIEEAEPDRSAQPVDELSDEVLSARNLALAEDELAVASDSFSTYVLNVTSLRHTMRANGETVTIVVDAPPAAGIPADAKLSVTEIGEASGYDDYLGQASEAIDGDKVELARFFDIKIVSGEDEIQPAEPVAVRIELADAPEDKDASATVVHFPDEGGMDLVTSRESAGTTTFDAEGFSVYGVVYTVDFHYQVDGKSYEAKIPGGGFVGLRQLVEELGVAKGADMSADEFVSQVTRVRFSDPDLVWTGKVEADTTVGELKQLNDLQPEPSADLTDEELAEVDAQALAAGDWALVSLLPFDTEESLAITMKNGDKWTIKVTDAQISSLYLSDSGELFEVTMTYGRDAQIPEGTKLEVTEFEEGSAEYTSVRNAVIADKQAKGEALDFTDLAALDISLIDPSGNEIEPAAPVTVQMSILKLPGVDDLGKIAGTLKVKHHVETEDGVVVETVYSGSSEAEFVMETDAEVAAAGTAVDPDTANLAAAGFSSTELYADGTVAPGAADGQEQLNVTFETPVFSSFTVQWNTGGSINPMATINWSNGLGGMFYIPFAQVNVHYVNQDGAPIARPSQVNDINLSDLVSASHSYNIADTFGKNINGRTYLGAHFGTYTGETVTNLTLNVNPVWGGYSGDVTFYNGSTQVSQLAANGVGYATVVPSADIYLVYSGESNTPHATVHYVDEAGNELTVVNGTPVSDTAQRTIYPNYPYTYGALSHNYNYLIYDIDDYEYAYTYRNTNTNANRITPVLNYYQNRWKYTTGTDEFGRNNWTNLSENDEIYVVYKKRADPPTGGTPKPVNTDSVKLDPATITKSSKVNGDGTNTLALSVTGHAKALETDKMADVIVIYDVSGSMNYVMGEERAAEWWETSRMDEAEAATRALAHTLLGERNTTEHPNLIRMALVSFSNTAQKVQDFTTDEDTFLDAVDRLPDPDGGTNWEYALQLANEMSVATDRATFVVFVTDGNPTFRLARQALNNGGTNGLGANDVTEYFFRYNVYGHGDSDDWSRNYAGALAQVNEIVGANKHFYTVGIGPNVANLTNLLNDAKVSADHGYTATNSQALADAFADIGARIIGTLGHSSISISDGITDLTQIVKKTSLVSNDAFKEDDFTYWKGAVDHLATQADVDNGLAGKVGDPVVLDSAWVEWDPATEKCEKATYADGAVVWNMGDKFMPEEGYTYQVRFNVWPSQEAYDLLAELNNAKDPAAAYAALPEDVRLQIKEPSGADQPYTLKTNDDTSYSYKEATKVDGIVTPLPDTGGEGSFDDVDPLHLTTAPLKLQKKFEVNYVDTRRPEESITLELYGRSSEGTWEKTFKTMTLDAVYATNDDGDYVDAEGRVLHEENGSYFDADGIERERVLLPDESWCSDDNFVSYGLLTYDEDHPNGSQKIYETGHDFTLREIGINAHYYELQAGTYRPMYINGTPTVLEQVAKPAGMDADAFYYTEGGKEYYTLDGKCYVDTSSDIIMSALNKHRSYMDLTKVVEGQAAADEEFEYRITFTVPTNIENYEDVERFIWFSVYNPSDRRTLAPSEYTYSGAMTADALDELLDSTEYSGPEYANYLVAISGQTFTLKIKEGWNVRFLNLPNGTTYSFEEVNIPAGYEFVDAEVSGTVWPEGSADGPAAAIDAAGLPENQGTSIGGTIELANARYRTTYTNRTVTSHIDIKKTRQDGETPLEGAEFVLYTKAGYEAEPKISARSGLTSDANGIIELGELAAGEYRLVETKAPSGCFILKEPVEITVNADRTVSYTQPEHNAGVSGTGVTGDAANGYQLVVINDEGVELPSTGGLGTLPSYLVGAALMGLAGAYLVAKRRAGAV